MSWLRILYFCGVSLLFAHLSWADVIVQLNINRPINDVSDKFVSFTMKPEDLYKALDGPNRKTITRMASMLSHSHVKFVGDYYFAAKIEGIRLRNPTKIIWKGFNKWTKAVNWSMIIPVPYKPNNWDAMQALKILNTSQMVGIDEAIWQLGTDFGSIRAADYVSEMNTFNLMVESFQQSVTNWQIMGADISAGSSPDETRRYVEMSRDFNSAYGWIQSEDMFSSNSVGFSISDQDSALEVLFKSNVSVWLSLPKKKVLLTHLDDEVIDGLNWAQTMGDAANLGFESIFKPLSLDDLEKAKYGFYVTALFKKIMGSRVYPARPLDMFRHNNKLYTHCANMVSGGLAFMVINKQEQPLQIAVRYMNRIQDSEVWQYALTMANGHIMLNNKKLSVSSTLIPEIRRKHTKSMLQLKTPGFSVSFWVLPNANLEHCQFTEVETPVVPAEETNKKIKRYSSTDLLLKALIKESAKPPLSPLASLLRRQRRSVDTEDRFKRFILEGSRDEIKPLATFAGNIVQEIQSPLKKDIFTPERRISAREWLSNIFKEPLNLDLTLLKRNARQTDAYSGPFFLTRDRKKTAFTKKITENKKPEKKVNKEDKEFDEEKFFKNVGVQHEPEYVHVPEGDVFLSNIDSLDGENIEEELKFETKAQTKEIVSKMKPQRLLPTEFYEALPASPLKPVVNKLNTDSGLNSMHFSDPFVKSYGEGSNNFDLKKDSIAPEIVEPQAHKDLDIEAEINFLTRLLAEEGEEFDVENKSVKTNSSSKDKSNEFPWWDLSAKRLKRSLDTHYPADLWHNNMINKDEDPITAADEYSPLRYRSFENKVDEVLRTTNNKNKSDVDDDGSIGKRIVNTFRQQVSKFLDIFSQHVSEWYNTLTTQLDNSAEETTTEGNRIA